MIIRPPQVFADPNNPEGMAEAIHRIAAHSYEWDLTIIDSSHPDVSGGEYLIKVTDDVVVLDGVDARLPYIADAQRKPYWVVALGGGNTVLTDDPTGNFGSPDNIGNNAAHAYVHNHDRARSDAAGSWYKIVT